MPPKKMAEARSRFLPVTAAGLLLASGEAFPQAALVEDCSAPVNLMQTQAEQLIAGDRHVTSADFVVEPTVGELSGYLLKDGANGKYTNTSLFSTVSTQLHYELHLKANNRPLRNKAILAFAEMFGFGLCGIDRCYMGQPCLGILKGLTLGGLFVWAFLDYLVVCVTCISQSHHINALGLQGSFRDDTISPAFFLVLVFMLATYCVLPYAMAIFTAYTGWKKPVKAKVHVDQVRSAGSESPEPASTPAAQPAAAGSATPGDDGPFLA